MTTKLIYNKKCEGASSKIIENYNDKTNDALFYRKNFLVLTIRRSYLTDK